MKTQIIQLESHDDVISVRDLMSWAKTPRIVLVWPVGRKRVTLRPVDLALLQRHAASLGAQLGLVTQEGLVRRQALELDLPVFHAASEAQRDPWPERESLSMRIHRRGERPDLRTLRAEARPIQGVWRGHSVVRVIFFALAVCAILALVGLFVPEAKMTLSPETRTHSVDLAVMASPSLQSVFITGNLPAHLVSAVVAGSQSIPASGTLTLPADKAQGLAHFRNLTESPIQIPAGTVIATAGTAPIRFATLQAGELAAGIDQTLVLPVQALQAGSTGNLPTDSLQAIQGGLGASLAVTNPEPTTGGEDRSEVTPTSEDRGRLRAQLLNSLREQAQIKLTAELASGDLLFPDTIRVSKTLEEDYQPPLGQPGDTLNLSMQVEFEADYASAENLTELARLALGASQPVGFVSVPESLTYQALTQPVSQADGITRWRMHVEQRLLRQVDLFQVISLVQGRTLAGARQRLDTSLALESPAQISLTPDWWPWLPIAPFRMSVLIQ
jgi:hypothetical protein